MRLQMKEEKNQICARTPKGVKLTVGVMVGRVVRMGQHQRKLRTDVPIVRKPMGAGIGYLQVDRHRLALVVSLWKQ